MQQQANANAPQAKAAPPGGDAGGQTPAAGGQTPAEQWEGQQWQPVALQRGAWQGWVWVAFFFKKKNSLSKIVHIQSNFFQYM